MRSAVVEVVEVVVVEEEVEVDVVVDVVVVVVDVDDVEVVVAVEVVEVVDWEDVDVDDVLVVVPVDNPHAILQRAAHVTVSTSDQPTPPGPARVGDPSNEVNVQRGILQSKS